MGLKTIEELNEILPILIEIYNSKYPFAIDKLENVTREYKSDNNIIFSYRTDRKIDSGHCINYKKRKMIPMFWFWTSFL